MGTKEQLLKAAIKLFVSQGFENTPTSQISKKANVSAGILFHYFKTKEDLINEAYAYVKERISDYIYKNLDDNLKTKEKIKHIWIVELKWGHMNKYEALFVEKFYGSSYIKRLTVDKMWNSFEKSVGIYKQAAKESLMRDFSPELLINIWKGIFYAYLKEITKSKKLNEELLEESFSVYWNAIKK